jgi:tetratricopeptide (TPR) repeat protein
MTQILPLLAGFLGGAILLVLLGIFCHRVGKTGNTEDMMSLPGKVLFSMGAVAVLAFFFILAKKHFDEGGGLIALAVLLVVGIPLGMLWVPQLAALALTPFFNSMTGGNEQVERRPFYSRAIALRKRGDHPGAVAEVQRQLVVFPGDIEGLLLLAEIHTEDLRDYATAVAVLTELINTPGRPGGEVSLALSRLAALQLNRLSDIAAARATYERLATEFPNTEAALTARQQLAHLPGAEQLAQRLERPKLVVMHHEERLGLSGDLGASRLPEENAGQGPETNRLLAHLEQFPDDWEAREKLARLYLDHWKRPDLAADQLERLISQPSAPARQIVNWLNDLADVQLNSPAGAPAARLALERIIQKYPGSHWAEQARSRMGLLGLDARAKSVPRTIKLGSYEQNIGLKRGDPSIPDPAGPVV